MSPEQKAVLLDHLNIIWGYSWAKMIAANPAVSQAAIHERIVAIKQELGLG